MIYCYNVCVHDSRRYQPNQAGDSVNIQNQNPKKLSNPRLQWERFDCECETEHRDHSTLTWEVSSKYHDAIMQDVVKIQEWGWDVRLRWKIDIEKRQSCTLYHRRERGYSKESQTQPNTAKLPKHRLARLTTTLFFQPSKSPSAPPSTIYHTSAFRIHPSTASWNRTNASYDHTQLQIQRLRRSASLTVLHPIFQFLRCDDNLNEMQPFFVLLRVGLHVGLPVRPVRGVGWRTTV